MLHAKLVSRILGMFVAIEGLSAKHSALTLFSHKAVSSSSLRRDSGLETDPVAEGSRASGSVDAASQQ